MRIRLYSDVPEYYSEGWHVYANSAPGGTVPQGFKRVAFDVDFPEEVLKPCDLMAKAAQAQVVQKEER